MVYHGLHAYSITIDGFIEKYIVAHDPVEAKEIYLRQIPARLKIQTITELTGSVKDEMDEIKKQGY